MRRSRRVALLAAALVAAGCSFVTEFWVLDDDTPVVSFGKPSTYERSPFGAVLAVLPVPTADGEATLVAVSAGTGSATETYRWAIGDRIESDSHLSAICSPVSARVDESDPADESVCGSSGTGAALLWLEAAAGFSEGPCSEGVLVVGQPNAGLNSLGEVVSFGRIALHCVQTERTVGTYRQESSTEHLGRALAHWPGGDQPLVAVGADNAVWLAPIDQLTGPGYWVPVWAAPRADSAFGSALAAGATADGTGWLAVGASHLSARSGDSWLAVVRDTEASADPTLSTHEVVGCREDAGPTPLGNALLAADLDGDGNDELLAQAATGVLVFEGTDLAARGTAVATCDLAPGPTLLACPTDAGDGVECSAEFGATLAAGDLDADGVPELLVGDPGARVSGTGRAGAVHVFVREATGWRRAAALHDATPSADGRLGAALATGPVRGRVEPFVGAPGTGEVFVFYCSGLSGDAPNAPGLTETCRPR
ncbi:MAG: FG-GAP repeat protein [Deltaproteobacteria bacterium]|nr:FG-GAP repeat protein [Deltaproteobacteria bacterium]